MPSWAGVGCRVNPAACLFYNLFSHPTWQSVNNVARFDPAGNQINDAFGTVMPDGSPRIIQLAVRFVF